MGMLNSHSYNIHGCLTFNGVLQLQALCAGSSFPESRFDHREKCIKALKTIKMKEMYRT